ncbi:MAG: NifB/NifX family molybdenum-iron cluster-binding protein [Deltaproteobacteria bacterium]|nr:NifB/NifX family molybdenum-iron cluster-binding protein [Deltaproteobacteria bacterium]
MKIAIPTAGGVLCPHFGHCEKFAIVEVVDGTIAGINWIVPPPHEPGSLPKFLKENGADMIISGGMGWRAQQFFREFGVDVKTGAPSLEPGEVVNQYLAGTLVSGENLCDH